MEADDERKTFKLLFTEPQEDLRTCLILIGERAQNVQQKVLDQINKAWKLAADSLETLSLPGLL